MYKLIISSLWFGVKAFIVGEQPVIDDRITKCMNAPFVFISSNQRQV